MKKRNIQNYINKCPAYIWCGIILIIMSIIMFHDFLFGNKYFLFPNIVTDMIGQIYASYVELAEKLADSKNFQWFSFASAWGRDISVSNPFVLLIVAFGKENVAYMLGIVTVLRLILAGSIFSAFLEYKGMSRFTAILLGICYAFSTQVFVGGCWRTQAELAVITALFLLTIEKYRRNRKWLGLVVAACFAILCLSLYYLLTLGAFLILYIIAEYVISHENEKKKKKISTGTIVKISVIVVICLIVGGILLYFKLSNIFQSTRFQLGVESLGEAWEKTFSKLNIKIVVTTFLRTLSPNILGIPGENTYYGSETGWYINDGSYYCGILILLICLNAFGREKRRNWFFFIALLGCGTVILCPAVRLITNGFADQSFKLTRMWGTVILLYIVAYALEEIFKNRTDFKLKRVVGVWGILGIMSLILAITRMRGKVYSWDYGLYLIFSFIYVVLLIAYKRGWIKPNKVKCLILCVTCIEVLTLNYKFVNNSDAIEKSEWENGYYNDGTEEIINSVAEENEFYRVDKSYCSEFLNDAQAQNYSGTMYYIGGIGSDSQTEFLKKFCLPLMNNMKGFCYGTYGYPEVESLMSVKYIVTQGNPNSSYGFEVKNTLGNKAIYENENWLPLAFGYDKVMTSSELEKISPEQRKRYLLDYVITEQEIKGIDAESTEGTERDRQRQEPIEQYKIENYILGTVIDVPFNDEDSTIVVKVRNTQEVGIQLCWGVYGNWENNYKFTNLYKENGVAEITLDEQQKVEQIILYNQEVSVGGVVDEVEISIYDSDSYYEDYRENVEERRKNALEIESYSQEYITGSIVSDTNQLLFISIPYDAAFEYYVDGEKVDKIRADYAFTALYLEKGAHVVEMVYEKSYNNKVIFVIVIIFATLVVKVCEKVNRKYKNKRIYN